MAVHRGGGGPNFDKSEYCRLKSNNKKYDYEYFNYVFAAVIIVLTRKVVISCKKNNNTSCSDGVFHLQCHFCFL